MNKVEQLIRVIKRRVQLAFPNEGTISVQFKDWTFKNHKDSMIEYYIWLGDREEGFSFDKINDLFDWLEKEGDQGDHRELLFRKF